MTAEEALAELESRIQHQARSQPVGSMAWRAHMVDLAHINDVRRLTGLTHVIEEQP